MKSIYALQPYQVGSKQSRSLAIIIPSKVAKKYNIDCSTIFTLETSNITNTVTLQMVPSLGKNVKSREHTPCERPNNSDYEISQGDLHHES